MEMSSEPVGKVDPGMVPVYTAFNILIDSHPGEQVDVVVPEDAADQSWEPDNDVVPPQNDFQRNILLATALALGKRGQRDASNWLCLKHGFCPPADSHIHSLDAIDRAHVYTAEKLLDVKDTRPPFSFQLTRLARLLSLYQHMPKQVRPGNGIIMRVINNKKTSSIRLVPDLAPKTVSLDDYLALRKSDLQEPLNSDTSDNPQAMEKASKTLELIDVIEKLHKAAKAVLSSHQKRNSLTSSSSTMTTEISMTEAAMASDSNSADTPTMPGSWPSGISHLLDPMSSTGLNISQATVAPQLHVAIPPIISTAARRPSAAPFDSTLGKQSYLTAVPGLEPRPYDPEDPPDFFGPAPPSLHLPVQQKPKATEVEASKVTVQPPAPAQTAQSAPSGAERTAEQSAADPADRLMQKVNQQNALIREMLQQARERNAEIGSAVEQAEALNEGMDEIMRLL